MRQVVDPYFNVYPVGFIESQLSFSGDVIKAHFSQMNNSSIALYKTGQLLDYILMLGYGAMLSSGAVIFLRIYPINSKGEKFGKILALTGIAAAFCDAIENIFILIMIADPTGFPAIIAISHSVFAAIKFLFTVVGFAYFGVSSCYFIVKKIKSKNSQSRDI